MNLEEYSKEDLALMYNQNQQDELFEELHNRFKFMIRKFIVSHKNKRYLEEDEIISLCHIGFLKAIKSYSNNTTVSLSTVVYRYIQTALHHKYDYMSRHGRDKLRSKSFSIDQKSHFEDDETPIVAYINYSDSEDTYFKNEFVNIGAGVNYALSKVNNEKMKPYIIPILLGEYKNREIELLLGLSKRQVQYQLEKFKKYAVEYLQESVA